MDNFFFDPYSEFGLIEPSRIVIHNSETNSFIYKKLIEPKQIIKFESTNDLKPEKLKYKYQVKDSNDRWVDSVYGYRGISNNSVEIRYNIKEVLKSLHFNNPKGRNDYILFLAGEKEWSYCIQHLLLDTYKLLTKISDANINFLKEYLKSFPKNLLEEKSLAAHYHSLIHTLLYFLEKKDNYSTNVSDIKKLLKEAYLTYEYQDSKNNGFKTGFLVAKGNILSIYNRVYAYDAYREAVNLDKSIVNVFLTLEAITTFYPKVEGKNNSYKIYEDKNNYFKNESINLCFSADSTYFKMYAINWLQASLYFCDLNYNFGLVVDSKEEFDNLVCHYNELLNKFCLMTGLSKRNNFRFFWIKSEVVNNTVYACARFYLASYLLNRFEGSVYITDIDQFVDGDIVKYLNTVAENHKHNIYLPEMSGIYQYLPGRSHLAGNVFIRNNPEGIEFSNILVDYVGMGLKEEFSWMLDQNATRYAAEIYDTGDLRFFGKRSLQQYPSLKRIMRRKITESF